MKTIKNMKKGLVLAMMAMMAMGCTTASAQFRHYGRLHYHGGYLQTNCHYYRDSPCNNHSHQQPPEQERPSGDGIGIFAQQQDAHRL